METPTSARVALPLRYRASKHFIYKTYIHRHREKVSNKTFKLYERSFNICINSSGVLIKALHFNTNVGTWKYCFKNCCIPLVHASTLASGFWTKMHTYIKYIVTCPESLSSFIYQCITHFSKDTSAQSQPQLRFLGLAGNVIIWFCRLLPENSLFLNRSSFFFNAKY